MMRNLPAGFGEMKEWRTYPNGIEVKRGTFWGGNVCYEAYYAGECIGEYAVNHYDRSEGNSWSLDGEQGGEWSNKLTLHQWLARLRDNSLTDRLEAIRKAVRETFKEVKAT